MKIVGATIENYRSIETLEIDLGEEGGNFGHILTGINESGKSNMLKALALLSDDNGITYSRDVNKKAKQDKKSIRVLYELGPESTDILKEYMSSNGVPTAVIENLHVDRIDRVVSFTSKSKRNDYYYISLKDSPKLEDYVYFPSTKQFLSSTEIEAAAAEEEPVSQEPTASPIVVGTPTTEPATVAKPIESVELIPEKESWEEFLEEHFLTQALESHTPRVIFWSYDEKYLINKPVNLTEFSADPAGISKPLHNVFNLAGYTDAQIPAVIADALDDGSLMGELAETLETTVTSYLAEVWPEHKVGIKVYTDAPNIALHVVESAVARGVSRGRYEVAERSDGFRHFFAILLNLAAENSTDQMKDCVILLDEPELHLHPSGAKFLRDELLKIAHDNTVVYSTHSIFMVDRTCLDRHYKVFKENETTNILKIDGSNPFKEELIYESLGTSVFDLISEHNLMVEGLTDKKLIEGFNFKFRTVFKPLDINIMSVDGESHFDKYCRFFNKKSIHGYILTDSDTEGSSAKTRILRDYSPEYNDKNTFELNEVSSTGKQSCIEDLIPTEVLEKCIEDFAGVTISLDPAKTFKEQLAIYNRAATKKIDTNKLKMFIADFVCNDINLRPMTLDKTKEKYSQLHAFVESLNEKLKSANS